MENEKLNHLRHSAAHLLAAAVMEIWPDTKRTIGPATAEGFYYDFDFVHPISEKDLGRIEQKMRELSKKWLKVKLNVLLSIVNKENLLKLGIQY